jgi:dihydroorotase
MELPEVVRRATAGAASALRRADLGTLGAGAIGDATLLELERGDYTYTDVIGETLRGDQRLRVAGIVLAGQWWHPRDDS